MNEDIERLEKFLEKRTDVWEQSIKDTAQLRNDLKLLEETNRLILQGYQDRLKSIETKLDAYVSQSVTFKDYIHDQESKKQGLKEGKKVVTDVAKIISWIVWFITALGGALAWITSKK